MDQSRPQVILTNFTPIPKIYIYFEVLQIRINQILIRVNCSLWVSSNRQTYTLMLVVCWWYTVTASAVKLIARFMGPIWGRQDTGGPHVGPMNFAIWGGYKSSPHYRCCCKSEYNFRVFLKCWYLHSFRFLTRIIIIKRALLFDEWNVFGNHFIFGTYGNRDRACV